MNIHFYTCITKFHFGLGDQVKGAIDTSPREVSLTLHYLPPFSLGLAHLGKNLLPSGRIFFPLRAALSFEIFQII